MSIRKKFNATNSGVRFARATLLSLIMFLLLSCSLRICGASHNSGIWGVVFWDELSSGFISSSEFLFATTKKEILYKKAHFRIHFDPVIFGDTFNESLINICCKTFIYIISGCFFIRAFTIISNISYCFCDVTVTKIIAIAISIILHNQCTV